MFSELWYLILTSLTDLQYLLVSQICTEFRIETAGIALALTRALSVLACQLLLVNTTKMLAKQTTAERLLRYSQ